MLEKLIKLLHKCCRVILFILIIYSIKRDQFDAFVLIFGILIMIEGELDGTDNRLCNIVSIYHIFD